MLAAFRKREILYLFPIIAITLDWGSTIITTLQRGEFAELNPIAEAMGFNGAITYAVGILVITTIALFKWGRGFEQSGSRGIILTDCLAIALTIQGFAAFFNNFGLVPVVQSFNSIHTFGVVTFISAAILTLLLNRRIVSELVVSFTAKANYEPL